MKGVLKHLGQVCGAALMLGIANVFARTFGPMIPKHIGILMLVALVVIIWGVPWAMKKRNDPQVKAPARAEFERRIFEKK